MRGEDRPAQTEDPDTGLFAESPEVMSDVEGNHPLPVSPEPLGSLRAPLTIARHELIPSALTLTTPLRVGDLA